MPRPPQPPPIRKHRPIDHRATVGARMKPKPRLVRSPDDAELVACEWLRYFGFTDADFDPGAGADGGVDIRGEGVVAQVKAQMRATGRPVVQQIYGIASLEECSAIVFSLGGFTDDAEDWADEAGVALFRFDLSGEPTPVNPMAHGYAARASGTVDWTPPKPRREREREEAIAKLKLEYEKKLRRIQLAIDKYGAQAEAAAGDARSGDIDLVSGTVFDMLAGRRSSRSISSATKSRRAREAAQRRVDAANERVDAKVAEFENLQEEFQAKVAELEN